MSNSQAISNYTQELCKTLNENNTNTEIRYTFDWGTKFHRVAMYQDNHDNSYSQVAANDRVFCFIDQQTGDVFAPKGWNRRAKGVRFNILDVASRTALFNAKEVA